MAKKFTIFILFFLLITCFPVSAFAKPYYNPTTTKTVLAKTIAQSPTPVPVVSSFELFWPMVGGKTIQSKIYFLKTLKEKIRGFFIFGSAQKADYDIFLGIKRMLEAEILMKANLTDFANRTLDSATNEFVKANSTLTNAKNSGNIDQSTKDEINIRLANLKKFVTSLIAQYPNYKDKLQGILDKLNNLSV